MIHVVPKLMSASKTLSPAAILIMEHDNGVLLSVLDESAGDVWRQFGLESFDANFIANIERIYRESPFFPPMVMKDVLYGFPCFDNNGVWLSYGFLVQGFSSLLVCFNPRAVVSVTMFH
jgi:hypothetical protein